MPEIIRIPGFTLGASTGDRKELAALWRNMKALKCRSQESFKTW
jgi:hypothetical protein